MTTSQASKPEPKEQPCRLCGRPADSPDVPRWSFLHAQLGEADADNLLREAVLFLEYAGARFEPADRGLRMVRGECPERVYEAIKTEILAPHAAVLTPILQGMRKD